MIARGANPFVVTYGGNTQFDMANLDYLSNLPSQKSVYFTTRPLLDEHKEQNEFQRPWFYKTGVFNGKFDCAIGKGAAGTVIRGAWFGKKAAFKFVEIRNQKLPDFVEDGLKTLDEKLSEMTSIQSTVGSKIVSFYGHYRYANVQNCISNKFYP